MNNNEDNDAVSQGQDAHAAQNTPSNSAPERPPVSQERIALVKEKLRIIKSDEKHFEKKFKRMREDMKFADGKQWNGDKDDPRYKVNIVQRHIQQRVSSLYAKNPTVVAQRRKTLDFAIWDEKPESFMQAQQAIAMGQQMEQMVSQRAAVDPVGTAVQVAMDPNAQMMMQQVEEAKALMQDIEQGMANRKMLDRIGKTMACLMTHFMNESPATFKTRAKQLIRRVVTTSVGYIKVGFQRINGLQANPDLGGKIADFTTKIAHLEGLAGKLKDGEIDETSAKMEELRLGLKALQKDAEAIIREGLIFDFPKSTAVIPDQDTVELKGWIGAGHLTQKFLFSKDKVRELYRVNLSTGNFTSYNKGGKARKGEGYACVYEMQDRDSGLVYTMCEGYDDFLEEPAPPQVEIDHFFTIFPLTFNDVESEDELFPDSDVELIRHPQMELNRKAHAARQHRIANAPKYAAVKGALPDEDKESLANLDDHDVVELKGLRPGDDVNKVLQRIKSEPMDPQLYDQKQQLNDILLAVGTQEANLGPTSGGTATESSIAEGSRLTTQSSCIDDVDDCLSAVMRAGGQILLKEMGEERVKKIAGVGAVWPTFSAEDRQSEVYLEIAAGSSGRPNKAQEQAALEKLTPLLIQIPGIPPRWLAGKLVQAIDDKIDLAEAYVEGLQSISQMNSAPAPMGEDPNAQGKNGGKNAENKDKKQEGSGPGGQPGAMPQPGMGA